MRELTESQLRLISRIAKSQDGKDLINEILLPMQQDNYKDLLAGNKSIRDETIGFGGCLEYLVDLLNNCDKRLAALNNTSAPVSGSWA